MIIEGKKNLEFIKRALLSHMVSCSTKAFRADDKTVKNVWDPEMAETDLMLQAVEINMEQFEEESTELVLESSSFREKTPSPFGHSPQGGSNSAFFR